MDSHPVLLFFILLAILMFFAGTEIPLMSVGDHKLASFIKRKKFGAKTLKKLKSQSEMLLITNLVGTTAVTIAISSFSTLVAIDVSRSLGLSDSIGVTVAMLAVSSIILLIGEIAPKIIGVRFSDEVALAVAPIYRILMIILWPLNKLLEFFMKGLSFLTGTHGDIHSKKMTTEEFEAFIDISREKGVVEDDEHEQIKNLLDLSETEAFSVMTPRVKVDFVRIDMTVQEVCNKFLASSHSRFPIYGEHPDDVEHVITFREAFAWLSEGKGHEPLSALDLERIVRVPLTQPLDTIFELFQRSRKHIALVLDEHGGVAGIITMEDIVEEVFGDIKDEKDREEVTVRRLGNGSVMAK